MFLAKCTVQVDCLSDHHNPTMTVMAKKAMRRLKNLRTGSTTYMASCTWLTELSLHHALNSSC